MCMSWRKAGRHLEPALVPISHGFGSRKVLQVKGSCRNADLLFLNAKSGLILRTCALRDEFHASSRTENSLGCK